MATTNHLVSAPHIPRCQQGPASEEQAGSKSNLVKRNRYFAQKTTQHQPQYQHQHEAQHQHQHQAQHQKRYQNFIHLRRQVAVLDGRMARPRLALGLAGLDSALAGGLALGRVHMLCANWAGAHGALTGFAICLLRQLLASHGPVSHGPVSHGPVSHDSGAHDLAPDNLKPDNLKPDHSPQTGTAAAGHRPVSTGPVSTGPIVWCPASHDAAGGMLYAAGLAALGLDPSRLLIVDTPNPARRLAVLEDILRTDGLAAVVAEYDGTRQSADYWMRLARRTQLAAEASMTTGFLLGWPRAASGFESLWHVTPAPDDSSPADTTWNSVWDVDLKQVRGGRPYSLRLAWDPIDNHLAELPARPNQLLSNQLTLSQLTLGEPAKSSPHAKPTIADAGGSHSGTSHPGQQARRTA